MSPRIEQLREAVEVMHKVKAQHEKSAPVLEMFGDKTAWEGVVESFAITGHPKAKRCYAWSFKDGPETRYVTLPPVDSPQTAVRAAVVSKAQK
ncbi:MAG TPA: hypothetical protein VMP11_02235 [Verrucomicrobiae bacterium]|nr:hypothetical protein [Verrucomicrobiae bacterium]